MNVIIVKNLTKQGQDKSRTWDRCTEDALWVYHVSVTHQQDLLWVRSIFPIVLEIKSNRLIEASQREEGNALMNSLMRNHLLHIQEKKLWSIICSKQYKERSNMKHQKFNIDTSKFRHRQRCIGFEI